MAGIGIEVDVTEATEAARKLGATPAIVRSRLLNTMSFAINDLANQIKAAVAGPILNVRSGRLRRSIQPRGVSISGDSLIGVVSSEDVIYFPPQEYGATITPKNAKFLTIPLDAMKTQTGTRGTARDVIGSPGSYGFTGTFFRNGVLFGTQAISGRRRGGSLPGIVPLFVLKSSVTLPERAPFRQTLLSFEPEFKNRMQQSLAQAVAEATS